MSQGIKNIIALIVFAAVAAVGYFMFLQPDTAELSFDGTSLLSDQILAETQVFIDRRQKLESLRLDFSIFTNERFVSLQSFETSVPDQPTGKSNLFLEAETVPGLQ